MIPIVRGLYLVQRVDTDPVTRNLTLVNCFRALRLSTIPGTAKPFYLVAYLANGSGRVRMMARVCRLDTLDEVFRAWVTLNFPDRLTEVRFALRVEQCRFSHTGGYVVELWADDSMLAQTPFVVHGPIGDSS
jgi:hypothetical protein